MDETQSLIGQLADDLGWLEEHSRRLPDQAAQAVLEVPPMSEAYFFWSGNGRPETAVRGWRRSLEHVYDAAKLERNGKKLRAHTHMLRHTFAIEKLKALERGRLHSRKLRSFAEVAFQ